MLTAENLRNLSTATPEDQQTIGWVLSRMQIEMHAYLQQGYGEPGEPETHALAARKAQAYINSLMRELTAIRQ